MNSQKTSLPNSKITSQISLTQKLSSRASYDSSNFMSAQKGNFNNPKFSKKKYWVGQHNIKRLDNSIDIPPSDHQLQMKTDTRKNLSTRNLVQRKLRA